uniref:SprT-like domain-containing protein n=1 Tax=Plectus sambesii TaxID=2011161 RepID=A0A914WIY8_9BILA
MDGNPSASKSSKTKETAAPTTSSRSARREDNDQEWQEESDYVIDSFCVADSDGDEDDVSYRLDDSDTSSEDEAPMTVVRKLPPRGARPMGPMCSSPEPTGRTKMRLSLNSSVNSEAAKDASPNTLLLKDLYPELDSRDASSLLKTNGTAKSPRNHSESEDEDDAFERYLKTLKTPTAAPAKKRTTAPISQEEISNFIVSDSDSIDESAVASDSSSSDDRSKSKRFTVRQPSPPGKSSTTKEIRDDSFDFFDGNPESDKENTEPSFLLSFEPTTSTRKVKGKMKTIGVKKSNQRSDAESNVERESTTSRFDRCVAASYEETFLRSLSPTCPTDNRHRDAQFFLGKSFKKNRIDLCAKLFRIYNETIFDLKLPADLPMQWNVRLRKTAGRCCYRRSPDLARTARIELSTKVCDTADRVRDTLIHELCHAAVWLIDGDMKDGHGPKFRHWATRACCIFPDLPMISRCHAYEIEAKFIYQCNQCKQQIKRHSKSLDMERKVCGYCRGRFTLLVNGKPAAAQTPRTNKFAQFVKDNYGSVKTASKSHKDVMTELGEQFKLLAAI